MRHQEIDPENSTLQEMLVSVMNADGRVDSRAVAHLYTLATEAEWQDMDVNERTFAKAALSRDNPPYYDVHSQRAK